tara:strand:- start:335 stop:862 length:528 start_codon:yes stop_codon:yes gene_type:complete
MWMLAGLVIACVLILWIIIDIGMPMSYLTIPEPLQITITFFVQHLPQILFIVLLIFSILIVINYYKWDLNPIVSKKLVSAIEVEGFDGVGYNEAGNFCSVFKHSPNELNKQCQELTKKNCLLTDCCGWLSALQNKKCIAGDKGGPKAAIENNKLDIMYDPVINILDHWEHREKQR